MSLGDESSCPLPPSEGVTLVHEPANVLVTSKGICKLGDFGCLVSMAKSGTPVGTKTFWVDLDTPGYQAPELLLGKSPAAACDVYSLGILLWQLDSSEVPCAGQHPQVYLSFFVAFMCEVLDKFGLLPNPFPLPRDYYVEPTLVPGSVVWSEASRRWASWSWGKEEEGIDFDSLLVILHL